MSIFVVLHCNGKEGIFDCKQGTPVGQEVHNAVEARRIAHKIHGWSHQVVWAGDQMRVLDYCPPCTKRKSEGRF